MFQGPECIRYETDGTDSWAGLSEIKGGRNGGEIRFRSCVYRSWSRGHNISFYDSQQITERIFEEQYMYTATSFFIY